MALRAAVFSMLVACAVEHEVPSPTEPVLPPSMDVSTPAVPDVRCSDAPAAGAATGWRHTTSRYIATGEPHHRGIDLIATTADATQTIAGKVTYSDLDKDLQDEDIELFACIASAAGTHWEPLGAARTDDNGRFTLTLSGDELLPAGMRDVYLSVAGDRTGAAFIAFVAPPGHPIVVSDVDGTLTASENAYPIAVATGGDAAMQPDAQAALSSAVARGVSVIYVTARGDRFTQDTRDWFAGKGFPRGPIRMPSAIITLPGGDTVEFKSAALASVAAFDLLMGFGNRASDVDAYTNAGLTPERILIKLPEFTDELEAPLMAGKATGFEQYEQMRTEHMPSLMP
jgi:phosphatidate phosphatase PAH1